jgi:hypothetical protein
MPDVVQSHVRSPLIKAGNCSEFINAKDVKSTFARNVAKIKKKSLTKTENGPRKCIESANSANKTFWKFTIPSSK